MIHIISMVMNIQNFYIIYYQYSLENNLGDILPCIKYHIKLILHRMKCNYLKILHILNNYHSKFSITKCRYYH